jgi:hypothetical protein
MRVLAIGMLVALLAGCGGNGCDAGALGAGDICPGPVDGFAHVEIIVLHADGSPAVSRQTFLSCGDAVGTYSDLTNPDGRLIVDPVYSPQDTLLFPFPPRAPDGSFLVDCGASAEVRPNSFVRDSFPVRFAPSRDEILPSLIELREVT